MSKILVTGSNGFVGSHLVNSLKTDHKVISLHHNCPIGKWQKEALEDTIRVHGDIRDFKLLRRIINRFEIDRVYHLACLAEVKTAYHDPLSVYDVNIMGTVALLEACRQLDVEKVLVLMTDKVYGEKLNATTKDPLQSSEPYATSKICQQYIAESYIKTYGMNILIPHSCNVFGADFHSNRIFPNVIKACIRGKSPLIFTNDKSIREYIYISDLLDAFKTLIEENYYRGTYNIATGWVYNQEQIVKQILSGFPDLKPKYVEAKLPPQIQEETMRMTKWHWKPKWTFDDAVGETIMKFAEYEGNWR